MAASPHPSWPDVHRGGEHNDYALYATECKNNLLLIFLFGSKGEVAKRIRGIADGNTADYDGTSGAIRFGDHAVFAYGSPRIHTNLKTDSGNFAAEVHVCYRFWCHGQEGSVERY